MPARKAPAKAAEKPAPLNSCACGCGAAVRNNFRPGHDARLAGQLRRSYESGSMTHDEVLAVAGKISPTYLAKVTHSLDLADKKKAAKEAGQ